MKKAKSLFILILASFSISSSVYGEANMDWNVFILNQESIFDDINADEMIYCRYCGSPNSPIRRTCNKCGKSLH